MKPITATVEHWLWSSSCNSLDFCRTDPSVSLYSATVLHFKLDQTFQASLSVSWEWCHLTGLSRKIYWGRESIGQTCCFLLLVIEMWTIPNQSKKTLTHSLVPVIRYDSVLGFLSQVKWLWSQSMINLPGWEHILSNLLKHKLNKFPDSLAVRAAFLWTCAWDSSAALDIVPGTQGNPTNWLPLLF